MYFKLFALEIYKAAKPRCAPKSIKNLSVKMLRLVRYNNLGPDRRDSKESVAIRVRIYWNP